MLGKLDKMIIETTIAQALPKPSYGEKRMCPNCWWTLLNSAFIRPKINNRTRYQRIGYYCRDCNTYFPLSNTD
jgi:hypothetical protein